MFLRSEAFAAVSASRLSDWDWTRATILIVSWDWAFGPEGFATQRLVKPLAEAGARVHVLSSMDPETGDRPYTVTTAPHEIVSDNKIVRTWQMASKGMPEATGLWVRHGVRTGLQVLEGLPADTIIYGRALPGASNMVAWHLSRRTGRPWVGHFSDPWPPMQTRSQRWNLLAGYKWPLYQLWRRRSIRDAGALTFTNPDQARSILGASWNQHRNKAFVTAHLPFAPARRQRPPQYDLFHIVHSGNFYMTKGHNAARLIQGLRLFLDRNPSARGRVRLTQAGWHESDMAEWTERCHLGDVVRMLPRLSQPEVIELLDSASLLIAVDYAIPNSIVVLSKLPDYLLSQRPILAITAPTSAMGRLFREDGAGLTAHPESVEEIAQRFEQVFRAWEKRELEPLLPRAAATDSFTSTRVLAELAAAFTVAKAGRASSDEARVSAFAGNPGTVR